MIEFLAGFDDDVVAIAGHGGVTADDYRDALIPHLEEKIQKHKHVRVFLRLDEDFEGFTPAALWEDTKMVGHWKDFGRIAVVSDAGWLRGVVGVIAPMYHHPVRMFSLAQEAEARSWIADRSEEAA